MVVWALSLLLLKLVGCSMERKVMEATVKIGCTVVVLDNSSLSSLPFFLLCFVFA